jgi:hypothetical protein
MATNRWKWGFALSLIAGCGTSGLPAVMDANDVRPASGAPHITRIRDIGTVMLPRSGAYAAVSDGTASPGELMVIEGDGFGRQPTVTVGSRAAEVMARVSGDGVVVRVPPNADTGMVDVSVTTSSGVAKLATRIERRVVALFAGKLRVLSVGRDGVVALPGELAIPGARRVRVDSTGGIAVVLGDVSDGSALTVVDLGRNDPSTLGQLSLGYRASHLAVAALAPRVAVVGEGKLTIIDTQSLRRPVLFDAVALPKEARGIRAAALSPDGKLLALLLADGNRVLALDVTAPTAPQHIATLDVLPREEDGLVRDLTFAPDGQTLWVTSGATGESNARAQLIPTRITAVRVLTAYAENTPDPPSEPGHPIDRMRRQLAVWKTAALPSGATPVSLYVGKAPDQQGSAIRTEPEAATVYVTTVEWGLLKLKAGDVDAARLGQAFTAHTSTIVRGLLGGNSPAIVQSPDLLGAITVTDGNRHVISLALHLADGALQLGVADAVVDSNGSAKFTKLGTVAPAAARPPFQFGDLAIQP